MVQGNDVQIKNPITYDGISFMLKTFYLLLTNSFGCFDHSSEGRDLKYS